MLSRKQVAAVFDSLGRVIKKSLRGNGLFTLPGLLKMKVVKKPATKAREGMNPFTGREDDVQGEAGQQESARHAAQEPQGLRELTNEARKALLSEGFFETAPPAASAGCFFYGAVIEERVHGGAQLDAACRGRSAPRPGAARPAGGCG